MSGIDGPVGHRDHGPTTMLEQQVAQQSAPHLCAGRAWGYPSQPRPCTARLSRAAPRRC
jgi:hypothetical protein